MSSEILIEVCCGSTDDAVEAEKGGAARVELSSSLFFGGLTPSLGSVIQGAGVQFLQSCVWISGNTAHHLLQSYPQGIIATIRPGISQ